MTAFVAGLFAAVVVLGVGTPDGVAPDRFEKPGAPPVTLVVLGSVLAGLLFSMPLLVLPIPAAIALAFRQYRRRKRIRACAALKAQTPLMLDAAVQRLASGVSFSTSLVGALRENPLIGKQPPVAAAVASIDSGAGVAEALSHMSVDLDAEWARLLAATSAVLLESGGQGALALDRLADTLRGRNRASEEAAAQAGQATASAAVLGVLPLLFALVLGIVNGEARDLYITTWLGAGCLLIAIGLTALCWTIFDRVLMGVAS